MTELFIPSENSGPASTLIKHFSFAISFNPGNDYSSFKTGDRISPINLPELIAIGMGSENPSLTTNSKTKKTKNKITGSKKKNIETSSILNSRIKNGRSDSETDFFIFLGLLLIVVVLIKFGRLLSCLAGLGLGLYGFYLCLLIVIKKIGFLGFIVAVNFFPIVLPIVPWYALIANGNWEPLLFVYGGGLLALKMGSAIR